jgi:hypothetical protein
MKMSRGDKMLDAAFPYAAAGIAIFPCEPANKEPCGCLVGRDKDSQGRWVPKSGGVKKATRDPALIESWWRLRPDAMIGAATGAISGFFVVDPDKPKPVARGPLDAQTPDGVAAWDELKRAQGARGPTIEVTTPSGGRHIWFRWDPTRPVTNREGALSGLGINVRGNGGYVILPPSCRWPDGKAYVANQAFDRAAIADAPSWLYDLLGGHKVKQSKKPLPTTDNNNDNDGELPWTPELEYKVRDALALIPATDRSMWLSKGAAIHSLGWGDVGRELWDEWSKTCPEKYDPEDQQRTWEGFDPNHPNGATFHSINYEARARGWDGNIEVDWSCSLIRGDTVAPESISWLWPYWLARRKLHVIAGSPGSVKTTIILKVAAIISSGGRWPCDSKSPQGTVIIWSGEDSQKDTLVPRLMAAGADMSRIYFIGPVTNGKKSRAFDPAKDIALLQALVERLGEVSLIVLDPVVAATRTDSHKNAETRRDLQPAVDLAESTSAALIGVHHLTKGTEGRAPIDRITGSLAFGAVPRVVWVATQQQPNEDGTPGLRVLTRAKSNIGPDKGGWAYDLKVSVLPLQNDKTIEATSIDFGAWVEGSAREILAKAEDLSDTAGARQEATEFLRDFLKGGPKPAKAVQAAARDAGHSWATVRRAKKELGVKSAKGWDGESWMWSLP